MRFGTWNVRTLYRAGSPNVAVQDVRWGEGVVSLQTIIHFSV